MISKPKCCHVVVTRVDEVVGTHTEKPASNDDYTVYTTDGTHFRSNFGQSDNVVLSIRITHQLGD